MAIAGACFMNQFESFPKFCWACSRWETAWYLWFRLFGYGLHFRWVKDGYTPLFSERNGYVKVLRIGRFWIKALKP